MKRIWKNESAYKWLKKESKKAYRYYYEHMNEEYKEYYNKILNAMLSFESMVKLPGMESGICKKIYQQCLYDNPLIFYTSGFIFAYSSSGFFIDIHYTMEKEEAAKLLIIIKKTIRSIRKSCRGFSALEKEEYIHDYLIENVKYELDQSLPIHDICSVFLNKKAVCDGISKAAKLLMDSVGIRSTVISGNSLQSSTSNDVVGHAWNIVWIKNKPYHVDFTFDNNLSREVNLIRYDYFNLSEEQIRKDHNFEITGVHAVYTNDWFRMNGLYFDRKKSIEDHIKSGIQKEAKVFGFRIPFSLNPENTINEIKMLIAKVIKENVTRSITYRLVINKDQMVIYILL